MHCCLGLTCCPLLCLCFVLLVFVLLDSFLFDFGVSTKNSLNQIIDKSDLNNSKLFDSNNGEYINKYIQNSKISPYFNKKNDYFFKNNLNMQKFGGHLIS